MPERNGSQTGAVFIREGERLAGYTVTSQTHVTEKKSTPRDLCPKGKADGLHPSLKNQDRGS